MIKEADAVGENVEYIAPEALQNIPAKMPTTQGDDLRFGTPLSSINGTSYSSQNGGMYFGIRNIKLNIN